MGIKHCIALTTISPFECVMMTSLSPLAGAPRLT